METIESTNTKFQGLTGFQLKIIALILSGKEVIVDNNIVPLTKSEYEICEYLARNKGQVFEKEQIYVSIFGYDGESDCSAITEHIKNIRAKFHNFALNPIETVWGIGYKWKS